jgi:hypothetical protein
VSRTRDPLDRRLAEAVDTVRHLPAAYNRGLVCLADTSTDPLIRSSTGGLDRHRTGKPTSRPPSVSDVQLRTALVRCTQNLSLATITLMAWDWPHHTAWQPDGICHTHDGRWVFDNSGPCWREPGDLTTTVQPNVDDVCSQLRAMLGGLSGYGWREADAYDREVCADATRQVHGAKGQLVWAGVWKPPVSGAVRCGLCAGVRAVCGCPRVCANCRGKPARPGGRECDACARYRQRTGNHRRVVTAA